jgi:hypothetical protein
MHVTTWIRLGPVAFLVHDGEEIATIQPWLDEHRVLLPTVVQPLSHFRTTFFAIGVAVLFAGFLVAAAHGDRLARAGRPSLILLVVTGAFVANGVTHLAQAAYVRGYVPGLVTALLVSLPYGVGFARAYLSAGLASPRALTAAYAAGLVLQLPLALAALALAGAVS